MKRITLFALIFFLGQFTFAQGTFKYVIVPTQFPDIGNGFNPYGVSAEIQKILNSKSIKCVFESPQKPADYCDALTVSLTKTSSMFRNKLKVELKDCINNVVWSKEGEGQSKNFQEGYAQALADAFAGLKELPVNQGQSQFNIQPVVLTEPAMPEKPTEPVIERPAVKAPDISAPVQSEVVYKPQNLYWNSTYFIDLISGDSGKKLVILNGKLLKYNDFQEIATMTPSGLGNVYNVQWVTPEGKKINGVANLSEKALDISLNSGDKPIVISLQKY